MQKSADAFRTISEVADDLSLPQHVLRFWETRFPQVRPLKRAGGRRYYRPADVSLLKAIRNLLYDDGYTIKGVQRLLKEQGARGLASCAAPVEVGRMGGSADDPPDVPIEEAPAEPYLRDAEKAAFDGDAGPRDGGASLLEQRAALEQALATVEECLRILDAIRTPRP